MNLENSDDNPHLIVADCVEIFQREGIIHVAYRDGAEVGMEIQRDLHTAFLKITGGTKMPFLFYNKGAFWISKDARELARKIEAQQPFKAVACWAPDLATRLMADFYIKFYKPEIPYKVFADQADAVTWLKGFN